jgi:AcrR family transcriptional regulator
VSAPARERERRYAGMAAAERRDARRRRLLDAGLDAFGTSGYASSSIEGLCTAAGVSTRHFYEHFDSREALLTAVYERVIEEVATSVHAASEGAPLEVVARSRAGLRAFIEPLLSDERKGRVVLIEVVGVSDALEHRRRDVVRGFAAVAKAMSHRLIAAGAMPERELDLGMVLLVGAVNELLVDVMYRERRPSIDELVEAATRLYAAAALAPV